MFETVIGLIGETKAIIKIFDSKSSSRILCMK